MTTTSDLSHPDSWIAKIQLQCAEEEERLKLIRNIRQTYPLFMEDHDYLYRSTIITRKERAGVFPRPNFLLGPRVTPTSSDTVSSSAAESAHTESDDPTAANPNGSQQCSLQLHCKNIPILPDDFFQKDEDEESVEEEESKSVQPEETLCIEQKVTTDDAGEVEGPHEKRRRLEISMNVFRETFNCGICLTLMNNPTTLPCGHSGCITCLQRTLTQSVKKCPICNVTQPISVRPDLLTVNIVLRDTINLLFAPSEKDEENEKEGEEDEDSSSSEDSYIDELVVDVPKILNTLAKEFGLACTNPRPDDSDSEDEEDENGDSLLTLNAKTNLRVKLLPKGEIVEIPEIERVYSLTSPTFAYRVKKESALQHHVESYRDTVLRRRQAIFDQIFSKIGEEDRQSYSQLRRPLFDVIVQDMQHAKSGSLSQNFIDFALAQTQQQTAAANPFIAATAGLTDEQVLAMYLPNHQISQCFRRLLRPFDSLDPKATEDDASVYAVLRGQCWDELLLPLMTSVLSIAGQHAVSVEGGASLTLVRVDDVLRACECFRPSSPLTVYGFGCGGIRGLITEEIQRVRKAIHPNMAIDEVALSIFHDMIVGFAIKVINHGINSQVTKVPFGVDLVIAGGSEGSPMEVLKTVQGLSSASESKTEQAPAILHLEHITAALHSLLSGDLLSHALEEVKKSLNNLQTHGGDYFRKMKAFSSETFLWILKSVCKPFEITEIGLEILVTVCEYLTAELIENAGKSKSFGEDKEVVCITPRNIFRCITSDKELKIVFPCLIRQSGYYLDRSKDNARIRDVHADVSTKQKIDKILKEIRETQSHSNAPFCHPFDGSIMYFPPSYDGSNTILSDLPVLEALTKVSYPTYAQWDNIFHRQLHGIDELSQHARVELDGLSKLPMGKKAIRLRKLLERVSPDESLLFVFDEEAIHGLFQYAFGKFESTAGVNKFCHLSKEACEVFSFLVEDFFIKNIVTNPSY